MSSASAGCTTGQDLAAVGHVTSQLCGVFVVDVGGLVNAELTYLSALAVLVILIESPGPNLLLSVNNVLKFLPSD